VERSYSKVFFTRVFLNAETRFRARLMGVEPSALDYALFAGANLFLVPRLMLYRAAQDVPLLSELVDRRLIRKIDDLLVSYGHAEYTTDPSRYRTSETPSRRDAASAQHGEGQASVEALA
jgi:hypothetical protein